MKPHRSPKQTIRAYCHYCIQGRSDTDVENCTGHIVYATGKPCPFYKYRMGKGKVSVKVLKQFCLECMGGHKSFVRECETTDCLIHSFRLGKNPVRIGKGYFADQARKKRIESTPVNAGFSIQNQRTATR